MAHTTTVNVRVDTNVKHNVEALFDSMGMNISTAVNMFFKQCLADEALPFQPKAKQNIESSREELYMLLEEGRADVLAGRVRSHKDVMEDLRRGLADGTL